MTNSSGDRLTQLGQFLQAIYQPTTNGFLALTEVPTHQDDGGAWRSDWTSLTHQFLAVRSGVPTDTGELQNDSEWYFVPSLLSRQSRQKEAVLEAGCLWLDLDDPNTNPYDLAPPPSIVVQSSVGKHHCYWLLNEPVTVINLEYYNRRLAYGVFGGDHGGWDASQLLRLPWGVNTKYGEPQTVQVVFMDVKRRYSLDAFNSLPDHPEILASVDPAALSIPSIPQSRSTLLERYRDILTVKLTNMLLRRQADRSKALWWIYNECHRLGIPKEDCFWLVYGSANDKFSEQKYNGEQGLWRDLLSGYAQAEAGSHDRGVLDQMQAVRQGKDTGAVKMDKLGKLLTADMARNGMFLQTANPTDFYYLDQVNSSLHLADPKHPGVRKLLLDRYGVNAGGSEFSQLFEHVLSRCQDDPPATVHRTSYYDRETNSLYVNRFDNHMYRVSVEAVDLLRNGQDGVLFVDPPSAEPWRLKDTITTTDLWTDLVFSCANVPPQQGMSVEQVHHILRTWVVTLFFRELMPVKPILFLHGEAGSGKTAVFKAITRVLQGKHQGAHDLPDEEEAYNLIVATNPMVVFDNVDSWKAWLPDKLAMTATSYTFQRRKLYTDNVVMQYTVSCNLGLTARTPKFLRDDVAERIIPIHVEPFGGKLIAEAEITERLATARSELWGQLIRLLQHVVQWIGDNGVPRFVGNFRQADFAAMLSVTSQLMDIPLDPLLQFIKFQQAKEAINDDPMMYVLLQWLESERNQGRPITPAELHLQLSIVAGGDEFKRKVPSPRGLSIKLGQMDRFLSAAGIRMEKKGSDAVRYIFHRETFE